MNLNVFWFTCLTFFCVTAGEVWVKLTFMSFSIWSVDIIKHTNLLTLVCSYILFLLFFVHLLSWPFFFMWLVGLWRRASYLVPGPWWSYRGYQRHLHPTENTQVILQSIRVELLCIQCLRQSSEFKMNTSM